MNYQQYHHNNTSNNTSPIDVENIEHQHESVERARLTVPTPIPPTPLVGQSVQLTTLMPQCNQAITSSPSIDNQYNRPSESVHLTSFPPHYIRELPTIPPPYIQRQYNDDQNIDNQNGVHEETLRLTTPAPQYVQCETYQPPPSFQNEQRLSFCKTPFHTQLVNKKYLRYRLYCILMATAVSIVTLGVLIGIYTQEYFIITATIPIGLIIFLVDVFCFYGYECYLETNNSNNNNRYGIQCENGDRSTTYCGLFRSNGNLNIINQESTLNNNIDNSNNEYHQQHQQQQNTESNSTSPGCCCRLFSNMKEDEQPLVISTIFTTRTSPSMRIDQPPIYEDIMTCNAVTDRRFERGKIFLVDIYFNILNRCISVSYTHLTLPTILLV